MAVPKIAKIFLWLAALALVLVGVTVLVISLTLGKIVTAGVNQYGADIAGTEVELASADISIFSGSGTLKGLRIANPAGWGDGDLATLGHIHLDLDPLSLMSGTIVIEDIDIQDPVFQYEMKEGTSNIEVLLGAINEALQRMNDDADDPEPTAPEDATAETLISVGHFGLRGGRVNVSAAGQNIDATLPDIDMRNLGTPEQGLTPTQLTLRISREVLTEITKAAAETAIRNQLNEAVRGNLDGALGDKLRGIFGGD